MMLTFYSVVGTVVVSIITLVLGVKINKRYKRMKRRKRWNHAEKDLVILHQFERGVNVPNLSPFAIKLETFLRMKKIRYVIDTEEPFHSTLRKCPWITLNGEEIYDSEIIISRLEEVFSIRRDDLTAEQHGIGRAVQVMLDEHAFVIVACKRYGLDAMKFVLPMFDKKTRKRLSFLKLLFGWRIMRHYWSMGVGRYKESELLHFLKCEIESVGSILGDKEFLFGGVPTVYDACLYGQITQIMYCCSPGMEDYMKTNHGNLVQFHKRMKDQFWPDWCECLSEC